MHAKLIKTGGRKYRKLQVGDRSQIVEARHPSKDGLLPMSRLAKAPQSQIEVDCFEPVPTIRIRAGSPFRTADEE